MRLSKKIKWGFLSIISGLMIVSSPSRAESEINFGIDVSGGFFLSEKLWRSAGREHQMKMTETIFKVDGAHKGWGFRAELVGLADEMYVDSNDSIYNDIYVNLGTSLTYYGDHPVREAWISRDIGDVNLKLGRMFSSISRQSFGKRIYHFAPYTPHSVILQHSLYNGIRISVGDKWKTSASALWGRDRPCFDGICYLGGKLDVNEKGNNTPVLELMSEYSFDKVSLGVSALKHKLGSAPGNFETGKHNDTRARVYVEVGPVTYRDVDIDIFAQYSYFLMGLTEEGEQGANTPKMSYDIKKTGWLISPSVKYHTQYGELEVRYTFEEIDRANSAAFRDIARFDRDHPVMNDVETRNIISGYWTIDDVSIGAHYTTENVSHTIDGDEFGLTFRMDI